MVLKGSKHTQWAFFIGFVLLSLVFHSFNLDHASYDLDEAVHIWHAQKEYSAVVEQASHDPNPPIYNLVLSTWVKAFGVSEFSTRFLSVLFGALGVGFMFLIASRNFGLAVGIMAALFYCFSPIQFRFTHLARPYSMLMLTVLLSYGLLLEALKDPSKRKLFWYYLATTLMIYVHPTSVFNLAAQGLIIIVHNVKDVRAWLKLSVPLVASVLTFGIWVMAIPYFERDDAMWFGPPTWKEIKYVIWVFYSNWKLVLIQLLLLIVVLIGLLKRQTKNPRLAFATIFLWCIVPFMLSIGFSHLVKPVFQDKYILSVQPALMLMLAFSIYSVRNKILRSAALVMIIALLFSSMDTTLNPEGDWKKAVSYIKPIHTEKSLVMVDPWYEFRTFSYYFNRHAYELPDSTVKILAAEGVFTGWHDIYDTINNVPKTEVVHLMLAHQGFINPGVKLEQLDSIATLIDEQKFVGIKLLSYRFNKVSTWTHLNKDQEFSEAVVSDLKDGNNSSKVQIKTSVQLSSDTDLEGVVLVTTVENPGYKPYIYRKQDMIVPEGDEFCITDTFQVAEFEPNCVVKTYLGNPKRKIVKYKNLEIEISD